MGKDGTIKVSVVGDASGFSSTMQRAGGDVDQFGGRLQKFSQNVQQGMGMAFGFTTVGLVKRGVTAVTDFIGDSIEAFKTQEIATARLTQSLQANAPGWEQYRGAIKKAEQAAIDMGFADEDLDGGLARVVASTHDVKEGLHVMAVAQDLARFKNISLEDAANALVKVEGGRYRLLGELGIKVKDFSSAEQALAAVEKVAAGQAEAYTQTLAGREAVLAAQRDESQEQLGKKIIPLQLKFAEAQTTVIGSLGDATEAFDRASLSTEENAELNKSLTQDAGGLADILRFLGGPAGAIDMAAGQMQDMSSAASDASVDLDDLREAGTQAGRALEATADQVDTAALALTQGLGEALHQSEDQLADDARETMMFAARAMEQEGIDDAYRIGQGIVDSVTQGLLDDQSVLEQGMSNLKDMLENGLTPKQLALEAEGRDYIKFFREGMDSEVIGAKESAEHVAGAAIKAIMDTATDGGPNRKGAKAIGKYLAGLFEGGMDASHVDALLAGEGLSSEAIQGIHNKYPQFFGAGSGAADQTHSGLLNPTKGSTGGSAWRGWGYAVAGAWITGFKNHFEAFDWANLINTTIGPKYSGQSPPKEGPLHEIDKWGFNVGAAWVDGFGKALGGVGIGTAQLAGLGITGGGLTTAAAARQGGLHIGQLHVHVSVPPGIHDARGFGKLVADAFGEEVGYQATRFSEAPRY